MLRNTFCHTPGISARKEGLLWSSGIESWDDVAAAGSLPVSAKLRGALALRVAESIEHLERRDPRYFASTLKPNQHWRLFPDFRHSIAYLDIETTGTGYGDTITTIALYDGEAIHHYVKDHNLESFKYDIRRYSLLVTYNGKCFDAPVIANYFGAPLRQPHIDLRHVLKSLGYAGGLKACERQLGIHRGALADVDGYFAVLLWRDYVRNRNLAALETLLAYNIQDAVNLEALLILAYNMKLRETPFRRELAIEMPAAPRLPFVANETTIARIRRAYRR